jgi:hypothetical protein
MTPVNDPAKLELMRCVYQKAVSGCECGGQSEHCPNCTKKFNGFYFGTASPEKVGQQTFEGKAIYRVKNGSYVAIKSESEIWPLEVNKDKEYFVVQTRDEKNQVVYEFINDETLAGWKLFKLRDLQISDIDELISALSKPAQFLVPKKGKQLINKKSIDAMQYRNQLEEYVDSIYERSTERSLSELGFAQKSARKITLNVPVGIKSSDDLERVYEEDSLFAKSKRTGEINPSCLSSECWFDSGTKRQVPRTLMQGYVGRYKGTYVWVPKCGRDQLTKLTLAILDIAFREAPSGKTTEVYAFVGKDGKSAASLNDAAFLAKADLPRGGSFSGLLPSESVTAQPPIEEETSFLLGRAEQARLIFKRLLVRDAGLSIYDLLVGLDDSSISYLSGDYRSRTVNVRNDDNLILLAAKVLDTRGSELDLFDPDELEEAIGDLNEVEKFNWFSANSDLASKKKLLDRIVDSARQFLDAEYQLQNTTGVASAKVEKADSKNEKSRKINIEPTGFLQFEQSRRTLGL